MRTFCILIGGDGKYTEKSQLYFMDLKRKEWNNIQNAHIVFFSNFAETKCAPLLQIKKGLLWMLASYLGWTYTEVLKVTCASFPHISLLGFLFKVHLYWQFSSEAHSFSRHIRPEARPGAQALRSSRPLLSWQKPVATWFLSGCLTCWPWTSVVSVAAMAPQSQGHFKLWFAWVPPPLPGTSCWTFLSKSSAPVISSHPSPDDSQNHCPAFCALLELPPRKQPKSHSFHSAWDFSFSYYLKCSFKASF